MDPRASAFKSSNLRDSSSAFLCKVWFHLCPFVCGCRRSPSSGDLRPRGSAGRLAADHRSVREAVASLQTFLPSAGGSAHSVQHSPHLRGGVMNLGFGELLEQRNGHANT